MTDDEVKKLRRAAGTYRDDLVIQLSGYVSLRAFEASHARLNAHAGVAPTEWPAAEHRHQGARAVGSEFRQDPPSGFQV